MKSPVAIAGMNFGSSCARMVAGVKPQRRKKAKVVAADSRQMELLEVPHD